MLFIVSHWSFPLWTLPIKEPRQKPQDLTKLRGERVRMIEWIEEITSRRSPPPAISRAKVEELAGAHAAWMREQDDRVRDRTHGGGGIRFRPAETGCDLPSYKTLQDMYEDSLRRNARRFSRWHGSRGKQVWLTGPGLLRGPRTWWAPPLTGTTLG